MTKSATICTTGDSAATLYLSIPGNGQRPSTFFTDGGFEFQAHSEPTPGTACTCPVGIDESFDGYLTGAWDGSFPIGADGGLPLVTGLNGVLVDRFTTDAGVPCACKLPCAMLQTILTAGALSTTGPRSSAFGAPHFRMPLISLGRASGSEVVAARREPSYAQAESSPSSGSISGADSQQPP